MFSDLGGDLPLPTQFLVTLSKNMFWIGPLLAVLIIGGLGVVARESAHRSSAERVVDRAKLRLPVFGRSSARSPSRGSRATSAR